MSTKAIEHSTKWPELKFRMDFPGLWRFVCVETGASVGPQYPTREALMLNMDAYARDAWGLE